MKDALPMLWHGYQKQSLAHNPYIRVNVNPSDRYVQSVPGSLDSRLRPDGSGVDNLYLAGDWVRIGLNAGCIEQAVLGGRAAARAITGVDMNSAYDNDRNWGDDGPMPVALAALLSNMPKMTRLALAGVGTVNACCIIDYPKSDNVQAMLPPNLTLAVYKGKAADEIEPVPVPVALVFSRQKNVRPGFVPFGGLSYLEFAIVVPYVFDTDPDPTYHGPYCYMPKLLLHSVPPILVGVGAYGFKKHLAKIHAVGNSFDIRNDEGAISAKFDDASLLGRMDDFPNLQDAYGMLLQPIISETSKGDSIYSILDYHLQNAEFQSLGGKVRIKQGVYERVFCFDGVPVPKEALPKNTPYGFRMVTNWDLTLPMRVGEHEGLLPVDTKRFASAMTNRLFAGFRGLR